jgi:hypothetical protein
VKYTYHPGILPQRTERRSAPSVPVLLARMSGCAERLIAGYCARDDKERPTTRRSDRPSDFLELLCGRCERRGRLSVARPARENAPETSLASIMRAQIGDCPNRNAQQERQRCDPPGGRHHDEATQETNREANQAVALVDRERNAWCLRGQHLCGADHQLAGVHTIARSAQIIRFDRQRGS